MSEKKKIKLTIKEIVDDFETLVRYDERLDVNFDLKRADDKTIDGFHEEMLRLVDKYIPTYQEIAGAKYFSEPSTYGKALVLYKMLYENFKEIFTKLV